MGLKQKFLEFFGEVDEDDEVVENKKVEEERNKIKELEKINEKLEEKIKEATKSFNLDFEEIESNFKKLENGIKKIKIDK